MARLQQPMQYDLQELMRRVSEDSRRLRDVEDRLEMAENRIATFEKSSLEKEQQHEERLGHLEIDLKNILRAVEDIKASLERLSRLSEMFAKKSELKQVERMAELLLAVKEGESGEY